MDGKGRSAEVSEEMKNVLRDSGGKTILIRKQQRPWLNFVPVLLFSGKQNLKDLENSQPKYHIKSEKGLLVENTKDVTKIPFDTEISHPPQQKPGVLVKDIRRR